MYLPILERVGPVLFGTMPYCALLCNGYPRAAGAIGRGGREGGGDRAGRVVMLRRHARMRLPPEQGKGLVDSGPIIP